MVENDQKCLIFGFRSKNDFWRENSNIFVLKIGLCSLRSQSCKMGLFVRFFKHCVLPFSFACLAKETFMSPFKFCGVVPYMIRDILDKSPLIEDP